MKKKTKAKKTIIKKAKKPAPKAEVKVLKPEPQLSPETVGRYLEAIGRRKTSVARVRLFQNSPFSIFVNQKPYESYFPTYELKHIVTAPISKTNLAKNFSINVKVQGGGIHSQAEAVRHGISRVLEKREPELRKMLKPLGFLKRDPRMKERRKFGLKKARKSPQWAKR